MDYLLNIKKAHYALLFFLPFLRKKENLASAPTKLRLGFQGAHLAPSSFLIYHNFKKFSSDCLEHA